MARLLALCSLPRTNPGNRLQYVRRNGPYTLYMNATGGVKLPYGNIPRLLLAYITTEAVRTQSRVLGVHAEARHLQYQRQGTHAAPQSDGPALSRFGDVDVRRRAESSALRARRWRSCSRAVSRLTSRSWCWPWRLLVRQVAMADAADTSKARALTVSVTGSSTPKNRSAALNASWRPLTACGGYSPLLDGQPRRPSGRRAWSCAGSHARRSPGRARACRHSAVGAPARSRR